MKATGRELRQLTANAARAYGEKAKSLFKQINFAPGMPHLGAGRGHLPHYRVCINLRDFFRDAASLSEFVDCDMTTLPTVIVIDYYAILPC